jgi:hypothetical protein
VICYLVKYHSGVYQSLSKEAKDTLRLVQSEFVDPASSSLDADLQVFRHRSRTSFAGFVGH